MRGQTEPERRQDLPATASAAEAYAPYEDPKIAIYVVIDRMNDSPQEQTSDACLLVREILTEVLPYLNISMTVPLSDEEEAELEALNLQNTYAYGSSNTPIAIKNNYDADGDGVNDSIDANGDGTVDTALDTNGDGVTDAVDTDGDGKADLWDTDNDGVADSSVDPNAGSSSNTGSTGSPESTDKPWLSYEYDASTGYYIDPETGAYIDPDPGRQPGIDRHVGYQYGYRDGCGSQYHCRQYRQYGNGYSSGNGYSRGDGYSGRNGRFCRYQCSGSRDNSRRNKCRNGVKLTHRSDCFDCTREPSCRKIGGCRQNCSRFCFCCGADAPCLLCERHLRPLSDPRPHPPQGGADGAG